MKLRSLTILILLAGLALPVVGHHTSYFDPEKIVTLTGKVARFEWKNPHAFLVIDVETPDGQVERWTVEGRSPNQITRAGWTRQTFKLGTVVTVVGRPPRDSSRLTESGSNFLGAGPVQFADGQTLVFGPIDTSDQ